MNFVPLKMLPNAISPRHHIKNIRRIFHGKKPKSLLAGDFPAINNLPGQLRNAGMTACVNQFSNHG